MNPVLQHLQKRCFAAGSDVHKVGSILVELGKYYITHDRTFLPQIHLWPAGKKPTIFFDQSPKATLPLVQQLRERLNSTKSATLMTLKLISPHPGDMFLVVVRDGDENYGWFTPYSFNENGHAVFGETVKGLSPEDFISPDSVHLEKKQ